MLDDQRRRSVPAAELVRNFAHWRDVGAREPVMVTHHGRQTHVFLSVEQYHALACRREDDPAPDRTTELAAQLHQGVMLIDGNHDIVYVNPAALGLTRRWDRRLHGRPLWDAFPEFGGTVVEAHIRHCLAVGEASAADLPSPFREQSWLHVQTFPFGRGLCLLLRDISAEVQRFRLADVGAAMIDAMRVHGGMCHVRLSPRGFIEEASAAFFAMVGLPPERLANVALADLLELPSRRAFREHLEAVLQGEASRRMPMPVLTNDGVVIPLTAAIVRLQGLYGVEGAVVLMAPGSPDTSRTFPSDRDEPGKNAFTNGRAQVDRRP